MSSQRRSGRLRATSEAGSFATDEGIGGKQMKVSIIVPVYDVEPYLEACLESALSQSMSDLEVVCVDDGSRDGSREILDAFAARDTRVRVICQANKGPSAARNAGLDAARGSVMMFLDGDDVLEPCACEAVCAAFDASDAEIVVFGARCVPDGAGDYEIRQAVTPRDAWYPQFTMELMREKSGRPYLWLSAYAAAFLKRSGTRFHEDLRLGEDQAFYFLTYPQARGVRFVPERLYRHRVERKGSIVEGSASLDGIVAAHLGVLAHIFEDWRAMGLWERYGADLLAWSLEFTLMDLSHLDASARDAYAGRLYALMQRYCVAPEDAVASRHGKKAMRALRAAARGGAMEIGGADVYAYYVQRRGVRDSVRRLANRVRSR